MSPTDVILADATVLETRFLPDIIPDTFFVKVSSKGGRIFNRCQLFKNFWYCTVDFLKSPCFAGKTGKEHLKHNSDRASDT